MAALSSFLDSRLALNPLIKSFLSSRERVSLVKMSKFPMWDLTLVLGALTRALLESVAHIKLLSLKTAFLLAITMARRIDDLPGSVYKRGSFLI